MRRRARPQTQVLSSAHHQPVGTPALGLLEACSHGGILRDGSPWRNACLGESWGLQKPRDRTSAFTSTILPRFSAEAPGSPMTTPPPCVAGGRDQQVESQGMADPEILGRSHPFSLIGPSPWGRLRCQCERCSAPRRSLDSSSSCPASCHPSQMRSQNPYFSALTTTTALWVLHLWGGHFAFPSFCSFLHLIKNPPIFLHKCSAKGCTHR